MRVTTLRRCEIVKELLEDIEKNGEQGTGESLPPRSAELTDELRRKAREDAHLAGE